MTQGFLVVETRPSDLSQVLNQRYRGIYRTVPIRQAEEHVLVDEEKFAEFMSGAELASSLKGAEKNLKLLGELHSDEALEIIFVKASNDPSALTVGDQLGELLGIDVAGDAPYYSIVADMPRDPRVAKFASLLNEHGLFAEKRDAAEYARVYFAEGLDVGDADPPLKLWEVYRVEDLDGPSEARSWRLGARGRNANEEIQMFVPVAKGRIEKGGAEPQDTAALIQILRDRSARRRTGTCCGAPSSMGLPGCSSKSRRCRSTCLSSGQIALRIEIPTGPKVWTRLPGI
jgi:hypothetical protein